MDDVIKTDIFVIVKELKTVNTMDWLKIYVVEILVLEEC